jgi:hypothetical protein
MIDTAKHFSEDDLLAVMYGVPVSVATASRFYYLSYDSVKARNPFTVKIYTHGPVVNGVVTDGYCTGVVEADEQNTLLLTLV